MFHALFDPEESTYFEQFCCIIKGSIDLNTLEDAWNHLIDQHPVFRTVFNWKDAVKPVQIVLRERPIKIVVHDLKGFDSESQQERISQFIISDRSIPFDLARGPLMRLNVLEIGLGQYYFIWSYHHILLDGGCLTLVMKDFLSSYRALKKGDQPPRLSRPLYKNYISWLATQDKEKANRFWREYLLGFDTPTPLPWKNKSTIKKRTVGEKVFIFSEDVTQRLESFARRERITMSTLFQSAWAILLGRYSNTEDVVFGSTIYGRPTDLPGSEEMIGLFINTLPVRADLSSTVSHFLQAIQKQSLKMQEYAYSFLPDIKASSSLPQQCDIFDSIVVFENYPIDTFSLTTDDDFSLSDIKALNRTNFDIVLLVLPKTEMEVSLAYVEEFFDEENLEGMLNHLNNILLGMIRDDSLLVSHLEILSPEEKKMILRDFNATSLEYPRERTLIEEFESNLEKFGSQNAVVFEDDVLTFDELNTRANMLAHYLISRGEETKSPVGMMVTTPIDSIVAIVGILKAGSPYLPIDPDLPEARIKYMIEESGADAVICMDEFPNIIPDGIKIVSLNRDWDAISEFSIENPRHIANADDIAYIIYTSGSTGKPKGIPIPNRGVVNLVHALNDRIYSSYYSSLRIAQLASFSFDASVQQIFASLLLGHALYPIPGYMKRDMETLIPYILEYEIEIIDGTPSLWELMISADIMNRKELRLKHIIIGGEPLSVDMVERFQAGTYGDSVLWTNVYGVTECSVDSTSFLVDIDACRGCSNIPIGSPIANTQVYILDRNMMPLPIGVPGELYIGGDGLAMGYLENPDLTNERFIANPFCDTGKLFKTGDMGQWLPNGGIEFLGRIDYQVKVRGYRVELGEVEHILRSHSGVNDCVVVDREDKSASRYLIAYYVSDKDIPIADLRRFLGNSLPDYMIPLRFIRLEALPLNRSGKVDRSTLPEIDMAVQGKCADYVEPQNELESLLAEVWMEVLNMERIGIYENFFDIGADSIISLQVAGRLRKRGYEIRPRDIFEHQNINQLASVAKRSVAVDDEQGVVVGEAPLTPIQRWLFGLELKNVDHFNQALLFKTTINIDEVAFRNSAQALLNHHDALRMRFPNGMQDNMPLGEVIYFVVKDVADEDELLKEVSTLQTSFDISDGPIFGIGLYRRDGDNYLLLAVHHLVVDGVSWRILLEDLFALYDGAINGGAPILPKKTTSYREWAIRLKEHVLQLDATDEISFWRDELADVITDIPIDHDLGKNDMESADVVMIEIGVENTSNLLRDAHRAYNTEVNDLLLAALMKALSEWMGRDDIVIDLEGHGREDVMDGIDLSRTVGWFTTIFPVALHAEMNTDIAERIKYVKEKLRSIPHRGFNYCILKYIKDFDLPLNTGISFNYLGQVTIEGIDGSFELARTDVPGIIDSENMRPNLIDVICIVKDSLLSINILYSANKHKRETIENIAVAFRDELSAVIAHCLSPESFDITPSDFSLANLNQEELDSLYE